MKVKDEFDLADEQNKENRFKNFEGDDDDEKR